MCLETRPTELAKKQALAAIGQVHLMRFYEDLFSASGLVRFSFCLCVTFIDGIVRRLWDAIINMLALSVRCLLAVVMNQSRICGVVYQNHFAACSSIRLHTHPQIRLPVHNIIRFEVFTFLLFCTVFTTDLCPSPSHIG